MTITAFVPLERSAFATPDLFAEPLSAWLPGYHAGPWCSASPAVDRDDVRWRRLRWTTPDGTERSGRVGLRMRGDRAVLVFHGDGEAHDVRGHTDAVDLLRTMAEGLDRALVARIEAAKRRHPSAGRAG